MERGAKRNIHRKFSRESYYLSDYFAQYRHLNRCWPRTADNWAKVEACYILQRQNTKSRTVGFLHFLVDFPTSASVLFTKVSNRY